MPKFKNLDIKVHDDKWLEAVTVFRKGDKAGALFLFKRLAREGCAPALVEIGNIYELGGRGVQRDYEKAKEWYLHSVEVLDDPKGHLGLGRLYLQAGKSSDDFFNAWHHLNLLVEHNNHRGALYGLATMYEFGLGVHCDLEKAVEFYKLAVAQGHILALRNLGRLRLRESLLQGAAIWIKACWYICRIALRNPSDSRLGIS